MGRAAPDRAPLPRGKGAGRSPKAGGRPGPRPRICGPGQTKSPAAAGPTGRANARQNASPVRTIPSAPEFHRFSRDRWGRSSRAFTAGGDLHPALKQPHYTTPRRRAQRFFTMPARPDGRAGRHGNRTRAAGRRGGTGTEPARPGGRADVRGTGRRPGTARHENRARAAICRAGPSFFAPPPQAAVIRRRRFAAAGGGLRPAQYTLRRT